MSIDTHFMFPNTDRMDVELDELSDSDESTEFPANVPGLVGPLQPLGIRGGGGKSFCCAAG